VLIGADPIATDVIWQNLYNRFRDAGQKGLVISAPGGRPIALWDVEGKAFGESVHRPLGGPMRTRVQIRMQAANTRSFDR
jgi:D-galactarolactone cycloisomerase